MTTRFIHLRDHLPDGAIKHNGGATIAYDVVPGDDHENKDVYFAFADCHWKDHYCKKVGRAKSEGKLHSPKHAQRVKVQGVSIREYLIRMYYDWKRQISIPRAGEMVRPWEGIEQYRF